MQFHFGDVSSIWCRDFAENILTRRDNMEEAGPSGKSRQKEVDRKHQRMRKKLTRKTKLLLVHAHEETCRDVPLSQSANSETDNQLNELAKESNIAALEMEEKDDNLVQMKITDMDWWRLRRGKYQRLLMEETSRVSIESSDGNLVNILCDLFDQSSPATRKERHTENKSIDASAGAKTSPGEKHTVQSRLGEKSPEMIQRPVSTSHLFSTPALPRLHGTFLEDLHAHKVAEKTQALLMMNSDDTSDSKGVVKCETCLPPTGKHKPVILKRKLSSDKSQPSQAISNLGAGSHLVGGMSPKPSQAISNLGAGSHLIGGMSPKSLSDHKKLKLLKKKIKRMKRQKLSATSKSSKNGRPSSFESNMRGTQINNSYLMNIKFKPSAPAAGQSDVVLPKETQGNSGPSGPPKKKNKKKKRKRTN